MWPRFKRSLAICLGVFVLNYVCLYLVTTKVKPQGTGGLTGPLRVRVFRSEKQLIAFYPLYLVERWVRNGSFCYAQYYFNVDFEDRHYDRSWLYGDGKYDRIWYDRW